MTQDQFHHQLHHQWSRLNDEAAVRTMLTDENCMYWTICWDFVRFNIEQKFFTLDIDLKEDAVQETTLLIYRKLSSFRGESKLTTWLLSLIYRSTVSVIRQQPKMIVEIYLGELSENSEDSLEKVMTTHPLTPEEIVSQREELREACSLIEEFLQKHRPGNIERNKRIMILYMQGYNYEEIAEKLGIHAPIVGNIVRTIRKCLKQKQAAEDNELDA